MDSSEREAQSEEKPILNIVGEKVARGPFHKGILPLVRYPIALREGLVSVLHRNSVHACRVDSFGFAARHIRAF